MLLMGGLLNAAHWLMYFAIASSIPDNLKFILKYVLVTLSSAQLCSKEQVPSTSQCIDIH